MTAKSPLSRIIRYKFLFLLFLPGFLYFTIFHYVPMAGLVIAFQNYDIFDGIWNSPWVGFRHFHLFITGPYFWKLIRNTLLLNILGLIFSFPVPIIFALLLNEIQSRKFKRTIQTVSYLPHFISTVVIVGFLFEFFSPSSGIIARAISRITGSPPVFYMAKAEYFRPMYILSGIWQTMGWGAIIYIAVLSGINPELYEAAVIDGANRWHKIRYISIPGIMPTIIIMLIINLGHILSIGFEKVFLMQNPLNMETSDVIATFVYRRGLLGEGGPPNFSYATAVNFFRSIIGLIMVYTANAVSRKVSETSLW